MKKITPKQSKLLEVIYDSIKLSGFPPSMVELREKIQVKSNQSVINFLKALEKAGCIQKEEGIARGIRILPKGFQELGQDQLIPMVGGSSCGPFVEAIHEVGNWMVLPRTVYQDDVKESQDKLYIIEVHGDSMINAGIHDGDMLLIKQSREYKNGDIVVARSDDGTTVKRFVAENKKAYLKPENPAYKNIPFFQETRLDGKVIANLTTLKRFQNKKVALY